MRTVEVKTENSDYRIHIGQAVAGAKTCREELRGLTRNRRCLLITDAHVDKLYGAGVRASLQTAGAQLVETAVFAPGEKSKTLASANFLYEQAVAAGLDRGSLIIALGGGVAGDLGGFVAATYMRGIDYIQWPTSLLALVDSSVGGKVAVDLPAGKNLVGAFHQPRLVVADLQTLATLPEEEFRCGLAEVVKYAMIMDRDFFDFLRDRPAPIKAREPKTMEEVVAHCCRLKAQVVGQDEREGGLREILNYGHTFGHALEVLAGYGRLTHGAAVALGMAIAVDLAVSLEMAMPEVAENQHELLRKFNLPTRLPFAFDPKLALETMRHDKKSRNRRLRLILPTAIGQVRPVEDVDEAMILKAMEKRGERG